MPQNRNSHNNFDILEFNFFFSFGICFPFAAPYGENKNPSIPRFDILESRMYMCVCGKH